MKASVMVFALGFALAGGSGFARANIELEFPDADENGPEYASAPQHHHGKAPRLVAAPVEIVLVPMSGAAAEPAPAMAPAAEEPSALDFPDSDENGL